MSDLLFLARGHKVRSDIHHWPGCERDHPECLIQRMADEIERLQAQLHEVREIYAGMDGFIPETAPEGYCLQTLKQMYNAAKEKRDE